MKSRVKWLTSCLVIVVLMSIIFSFIYICEEKNHHCSGEDCPICLQLQQAHELLNVMKQTIMCIVSIISIPIILVHLLYSMPILHRQRTLITLKVKLRN